MQPGETLQNFISERNRTMISKTWQGYYISKRVKNSEFHHYVKSIYKGEITWTTDYTYAKHYSEKTAKRLDAEIEESLLNGTCNNEFIIADSEVQEAPEVVEEQKPEEIETKEFFWNDEVKDIDEAMNHMLDCIAICSKSEYESDKVALEYCKSEYIRLAEVRAKAAKEWLAVW